MSFHLEFNCMAADVVPQMSPIVAFNQELLKISQANCDFFGQSWALVQAVILRHFQLAAALTS
jgi:hypothetical protein